jgi:hypothetical protein
MCEILYMMYGGGSDLGKGKSRITNRIRQLRLEAGQMTQQARRNRLGRPGRPSSQ